MTENELSKRILNAAFEVHNSFGPGLLESAYQECLFYMLKMDNLYVEKEKPMPLVFHNVKLDCGYRIDLFG